MKFGELHCAVLSAALAAGVPLAPAPATAQVPVAWDVRPDLPIGPQDTFAIVSAVLIARDSSVIIADSRKRQLRMYDSGGKYSRSIGMRRGYTDFEQLRYVGFVEDTVAIVDRTLIAFYDQTGERLDAIINPSGVFVTAVIDGGLAARPTHKMEPGVELRFERTPILAVTRSGTVVDTLASIPTWNERIMMSNRRVALPLELSAIQTPG